MRDEIVKKLVKECECAYAPYSNFHISAAVVNKEGMIYKGINIENASYGLSMCAERVVLYKYISEHQNKENIVSFYIVSKQETLVYPCGACLQVMKELLPRNCEIIIANEKEIKVHTLQELYPFAFDKEDLHEF